MINFREKLEERICSIISSWNEDGIYAISFLVYSNESYEYRGFNNVPMFAISYNTELDCSGAGEYAEERWNYAFWRQDEEYIIDPDNPNYLTELLFNWYEENGIDNIGCEDPNSCYNENMEYIGKGPVGVYELLLEITSVAKKMQDSGFIKEKFNRSIPIIIHDLEYSWYVIEATQRANSHGEADTFFAAMRELGMME